MNYLDMKAHVGITEHYGGFEATNELLSLCHIEDAREVLNVGCGIGVGPAYIAREEGVEDRVELRTADVLELPFEADRFDVVIVESVLAFVEDKQRAIREGVRVTKPGGYVGLNEMFWIKEPSPEIAGQAY